MASSGKLEVEVELKSSAEKVWGSLRDSASVFPTALPHYYKSIRIIEGDGKSAGSVRKIDHGDKSAALVSESEEKIEAVDDAHKTLTYSVGGPQLRKYFKSYRPTLEVLPKGSGSSIKWCCDVEKAAGDDQIPDLNVIKDLAVQVLNDLDAYLLKA